MFRNYLQGLGLGPEVLERFGVTAQPKAPIGVQLEIKAFLQAGVFAR